MALNKAMLIGNVGNDPEVRILNNEQGKVASFRLATTERYKDRNGEVKENTEWHQIISWGKLADIVEKFVKKGSQVYVEGKITTRKWTDKDGNDRFSTEIRTEGIQLLGKKETDPGKEKLPLPYKAQAAEESASLKALKEDDPKDDLPF